MKARPGRAGQEAGVALVAVLLVLSLLLAVAAEFAQITRLDAATAVNFRQALAAGHLAVAAYQRAVVEVLPEALSHELDVRGQLVFRRTRIGTLEAPPRIDLALGPQKLSYRITDESARLSVNRAPPDLLRRLLDEAGVDRSVRDEIVDSIQDWRDPNEEHRLNGAESDYYLERPVPHRSKNGDLDAVDELLQVRGVTRAILYGSPGMPGLAEYLTVVGAGVVNVNTASATVLRAQGLAQAEVDLLVAGRPYADPGAIPGNLRRGGQRTRSDTFRIEAWAGGAEPTGRVLTAVVQRRVSPDGSSEVVPLEWRWRDLPAMPASPR